MLISTRGNIILVVVWRRKWFRTGWEQERSVRRGEMAHREVNS